MRNFIFSALASILLFPSVSVWGAKLSHDYKDGEILVKLSRETYRSQSSQHSFALRQQASGWSAVDRKGLVKIKLRPGQSVEQALERAKKDPSVEFAQPNFRYHITAVPNDTSYGDLWGLKNTGQTIATGSYSTHNPGTSGRDISAQSAWDIITDCSSVTVAVIDTGVNYNHTDLNGNMWDGGLTYPHHGYDFVGADDDDPMDLNGHGTHVAGIIGAEGNNASGATGVCWTAKIMALRALDASGTGYTSDIVAALNFAVAQGARVVNMSLGGGSYDSAFQTSITDATTAGVVLAIAAGNDGTNNSSTAAYPCNYTSATLICVAALDQSFSLASFSNYSSVYVDVGAPGTNVLSNWHGTETETSDNLTTWTTDATWVHQSLSLGGTTYDLLTNPAAWTGPTGGSSYANSLDAKAHKSFNLSAADAAVLDFYAFIDTESSADFFRVGFNSAGGDAFSAGTLLDSMSGSTGSTATNLSYDLSSCLTATCNIGLNLTSDASTTARGVGVLLFNLTTTVLNNITYNTISGTSMATPYVAGAAAMLFAQNPNYTAADVVNSIKRGGTLTSSLTSKTSTGRALNLLGSLQFIAQPTGVSATLQ